MEKYKKVFKESGNLESDGFSKEFLNVEIVRNYIRSNPAGYFGHFVRSGFLDVIIEDLLITKGGLTNEQVGEWLTSSSARHWMDSIGDKIYKMMIPEAKQLLKQILLDLHIWNKRK